MVNENLISINVTRPKELQLLLLSIKIYSSIEGIDFLILTPTPLDESLSNVINALELPITIQIIAQNDNIFDNYNKVLELNTNLIVQGDISRIFDLEFKGKVCTIDSDIIKPFLYSSDESIPESCVSDNSIIVCNFTGEIDIQERMNTYFKNLLEYYKNSVDESKYSSDNILRKQYEWGSGRILFEQSNNLITPWTNNNAYYKLLNTHIIEASWAGYTHILIMNNDYTKYVCIRSNDLYIGNGNIDNTIKDSLSIIREYNLTPIQIGNRNLVYFCVFFNIEYMNLLKILLLTIKLYSKLDSIDFLILTSKEFVSSVKELSETFNIPIKVKLFNFDSMHEASCARLFIYDYEYINDYNKILYIDTDIVVQNDISRIFDIDIDHKIYAIQESTINEQTHGGWFFDFTTIDKNTPGINAGVLLFRNSHYVSNVFNDINAHISFLKNKNSLLPLCLDQPFIVYHLFKNWMYNSELMKDYIYLSMYESPPPEISNSSTHIFCHFIWPVGNALHKKNRMIQYATQLVNTIIRS